MNKIYFLIFLFFLLITNNQFAKELLIYADVLDYDSDKSIVAKGNVKIISKKEIITSDLIIINEKTKKIILPQKFEFKDEYNNYYFGTSGEFDTNLEKGNINDFKLLLNDGSRIVGKEAFIDGDIDLINKGVYSPCTSRIKIKNFICPIWQIEGEKILHDRKNLFIHQKHSKMRILNVPVFYIPYLVAPSPLRKERKSGFLNPTINYDFTNNTKTTQSISTPYYFAMSEDKALLFTPTIRSGGGVDTSQTLEFDYQQLISGGIFNFDTSFDTTLENKDNEDWFKDASIIANYKKNLNQNYNIKIESAFQTSPTYLRRTDKDNLINRESSLATTLNLNGYDLYNKGDQMNFNISTYQVVKKDEDNKTTPTSLPYISYISPSNEYKNTVYQNYYYFYNIFRETTTDEHAKRQQKLNHVVKTNNEFIKYNSKINFKTEFHTQAFNVENKKINNSNSNDDYYRLFPMTGIFLETPMVNKKNNFYFIPKLSFIINSGQSNSNKISNELTLACKEYKKAINIIETNNNYHQHLIISHINLGQTYVQMEKYKQALDIYEKALKICEKSGSEMDLGFLNVLLAEVSFNRNHQVDYRKYIGKGKKLVEKSGYPEDILYLNRLLFRSYATKGNLSDGIALLLKSLNIC